MQFTHPHILYALVALAIPILVHLFQLRRFEKVAFTNVAFLKEIILQTRKSSQLKKWLILCSRLLLLASIIIAFAGPFYANFEKSKQEVETVIYLDNSFSMQAKGERGELLKRAVQDLLINLPEDQNISVFTNEEAYLNNTIKGIKNDLIDLNYSSNQLPYKTALLKGKQYFSKNPNTRKQFLFISDFQNKKEPFKFQKDSLTEINFVQLAPQNRSNISIDSVYIKEQNATQLTISVAVNNDDNKETSLSFYNKDKLLGKAAISKTEVLDFPVNRSDEIHGRLVLNDASLKFDNTFYFTIIPIAKINVLAIGDVSDEFLKNIYTDNEFNFSSVTSDGIDYNLFPDQHLVILNELNSIPMSLANTLKEFEKNGGTVLIIPSLNASQQEYNSISNSFGNKIELENRITKINFDHPILNGVFEKKVTNFQFPKLSSFFQTRNYDSNILSLENGNPFIFQKNKFYSFSGSLVEDNSNFKNSPLIVPILYNIGKNSYKLPQLYYTIGRTNVYEVPIALNNDQIISLNKKERKNIPLQKKKGNNTEITTNDLPNSSGIYTLKKENEYITAIGYNYDRLESILNYTNLEHIGIDKDKIHENVNLLLENLNSKNEINALWKWFVIFALIFLVIEILLIKYLK